MKTMTYDMLPLVSVVIPAYNHKHYVVTCLDSVLNDSYPNKELVIIDDGSTDSTKEEIQAWIEKNSGKIPVVFRSRGNRGPIHTANELIALSSGEYLVLLASDDFLLPDGIIKRYEILNNTDKLAVFADCIVVDAQVHMLYKSGIEDFHGINKELYSNKHLLSYALIFSWAVPGPVFMVKKDAYVQLGNYDPSTLFEDWDFYLRLAARDMIAFVDHPVAAYRYHKKNMIDQVSTGTIREWKYKTAEKNVGSFRGLRKLRLYAILLTGGGLAKSNVGSFKESCRYYYGVALLYISYILFRFLAAAHGVGSINKRSACGGPGESPCER